MYLLKLKAFLFMLATVLNIGMGALVYWKNPKNKLNFNLGLMALFSGLFTFAYGIEYIRLIIQYNSIAEIPALKPLNMFGAKMSYIGAFIFPAWYVLIFHLKAAAAAKIRLIGFVLYSLALVILTLSVFTNLILKGIVFQYPAFKGIPGSLSFLSRFYVMAALLIGIIILYKFYKESSGLKRIQIKYLSVGMLIYALSGMIFVSILPLLGIRGYTEGAALMSIFFVGFTAYAIIRYRFLDIETVIHKTLLWLVTSGLILIPMAVVLLFTYNWLTYFTYTGFCFLIMALFFAFLYLYQYIQPRINHLFRRKQYDYQQILLEVGEKLTREIDIQKATATLVNEVTRLMYLRQGVVFVRNEDSGEYQRYASIGQTALAGMPDPAVGGSAAAESMKSEKIKERYPLVIEFLVKKPEILERQQIGFNPEYKEIKEEGERLFAALNVELLIPLTIEGKILGLLGLGKKETLKAFNPQDLEVLQKVGSEAGIALYNALHHEAIVEKERLAEEMRLGREIQQNLLPQSIPNVEGLKVAGFMRPAKEIGGDYYDYIIQSTVPGQQSAVQTAATREAQTADRQPRTTDRLSVVIGDVSGKGAAAGLIMATVKAILDTLSGEKEVSPKKVLARANSILCKYTQGSKFMTLLLFNWDSRQKSFEYASAGHEHIIICRSAGSLERQVADQPQAEPLSGPSESGGYVECIKSGGMPLGLTPEVEGQLEDKQLKLEYGDKVVLFTDGVTEARNEREEFYGLERFVEMVKKHDQQDAACLLQTLDQELNGFMGQRYQNDDITLVVMEAVRE